MQNVINVLVFMLVLGSIIAIHEFGHFIAAKYFDVYCSHFSIGFGPRLFSKKGKETEYEIRALPIGGFVSMAGEADQEEVEEMKDVPLERTLKGKKTYQKVIIFLAGVFMNFVLAVIVLFASNLMAGQVPVDRVQIDAVENQTPAAQYGLKANDIIEKIYVKDSKKTILIDSYETFSSSLTKENFGTTDDHPLVTVQVKRENESKNIDMKLQFNEQTQNYYFGIVFKTRRMSFIESITYTVTDVKEMSTSIVDALRLLVVNFASTVKQLSGPAGIYQVTAQVTETGQVASIFRLVGLLSINIGIFNLLPIPGLDGCQVLFAVVERIIGKELPQKLKLILQMVGLGLVLLLMFFVTYQDLMRIFG